MGYMARESDTYLEMPSRQAKKRGGNVSTSLNLKHFSGDKLSSNSHHQTVSTAFRIFTFNTNVFNYMWPSIFSI